MSTQLISLIVPIFNEEKNIKLLYDKVCLLSFEWELIFVDDGSTDASAIAVSEIAMHNPQVKLIQLRRNYGQTAALAAGFDHASGEIVVPLDGDLQNDPADIPALLSKLSEGYDVVSGWRKERWRKHAFSRRIPSLFANWLISTVTGVHLHDYGCTLKAYRKELLDGVKLYGEMHRFIPAFAKWQGARVVEIPVADRERMHGETKYGISRTFRVVLDLITVKFLTGYSTKPMHFFGTAGFLSLLVSVASVSLALYWKWIGKASLIQTPMPLFSAFFFIVGVQFFLMGLIAEMMTRNYYETSGRLIYDIKKKINVR